MIITGLKRATMKQNRKKKVLFVKTNSLEVLFIKHSLWRPSQRMGAGVKTGCQSHLQTAGRGHLNSRAGTPDGRPPVKLS